MSLERAASNKMQSVKATSPGQRLQKELLRTGSEALGLISSVRLIGRSHAGSSPAQEGPHLGPALPLHTLESRSHYRKHLL